MNWTTELPFILDGVEGDLRLTYTPMGQKFYQNGVEIKRSGSGFGGQKYKVQTTDGGDNVVKVKANIKTGRQIVYRGETVNLETPLSAMSTILSMLPFVFIVVAIVVFSHGQIGILGGALLGGCGALGMLASANIIRSENNFVKQLLYTLVVSVATTLLFFALAIILGLIFGTILGVAMFAF
ncbi:hypothetical protein [Dysgonomonas sp. 511]|uniref:hypothetical protein n=1 Tax=Dysgonomonas sp. 511 TaxID=2302930 RepID=UPI0013D0E8B8|nr:hypothetical protein [Dysgonomonas sp. 511]NDV77475.1 hypothetical protein [Dysgonomonas sp. 511]